MALDRERLVKLLNMTGSRHDAEALSAIRLSNEMMRQNGMTWVELLATPSPPKPPTQNPPPPPPPKRPAAWPRRQRRTVYYRPSRASREGEAAKERLRGTIRAVPLVLRVIFFPAWLFAVAYANVGRGESWPMKTFGLVVSLLIGGVAGGLWVLCANYVGVALAPGLLEMTFDIGSRKGAYE